MVHKLIGLLCTNYRTALLSLTFKSSFLTFNGVNDKHLQVDSADIMCNKEAYSS